MNLYGNSFFNNNKEHRRNQNKDMNENQNPKIKLAPLPLFLFSFMPTTNYVVAAFNLFKLQVCILRVMPTESQQACSPGHS